MVAEGFHSLPGDYQAETYAILPKIVKLQNVDVNEFLHFINDLVCDRPIPSDSIFLAKEVKPLVDAYKLFFKQAVNLNLTKDQIIEDLKKANVSESVITVCVETLLGRWEDTRKALEIKSSSVSANQLLDFDWKVNLVASSSMISSVQSPVLLLNLSTQRVSGTREDVTVELDKDQLDQLLVTMSNINEVVQKLRV